MGWERTPDGNQAWIIENTWGPTWGDNGYGYVVSNGETQLDFFALGLAAYPMTMAEYYAAQAARKQQEEASTQEFSFTMPEDPDEGATIDLDSFINKEKVWAEEHEPEEVVEIDQEL